MEPVCSGYIAFGDIHGCLEQMEEVLSAASAYPGHIPVFLGDYISRGPDPEGVIRRLMSLGAVCLMGNHERMLLNALASAPTTEDRLHVLNMARISSESADWLRSNLRLMFETPEYVFVHAGLDPDTGLPGQGEAAVLWSRNAGDYTSVTNKIVIHGHTTVDEPEIVGNRININTLGGYGGPLTVLVLPEMVFLKSSLTPGRKPSLPWDEIRDELDNLMEELEAPG